MLPNDLRHYERLLDRSEELRREAARARELRPLRLGLRSRLASLLAALAARLEPELASARLQRSR